MPASRSIGRRLSRSTASCDDLDCRRLSALAREQGIAIGRGDRYFAGPRAATHCFRLGFGTIQRPMIEPGIRRLAALVPYARSGELTELAS